MQTLQKHSPLPFMRSPQGAVLDYGITVPSDGAAGYAPGCVFIHTDGADGAQFYVNEGSATSCEFNPKSLVASDNVVSVTSSSLTLTERTHNGKVMVLDRAAGIAITLPAAAAGLRFEFIVKTTFTGAASIKSATGADIMIGHALLGNDTDNTTVLWQAVAASTLDTIDLFGTANSTGGIAGERIIITGLGTNLWHVDITGDAAGTEATPFANTVA